MSWAIGSRIDGYLLERELGRGGMGLVYLASDPSGRRVALKTLLRGVEPRARERFLREGQAQAQSEGHEHLVRVHAGGEHEGQPYLVCELLEGGSLGERLKREGRLAPREACALVAALARGMEHAHARGIVHRDLKPENVWFDEANTPKVGDFGLARTPDSETLTRTGQLLGTLAYMAPEQVDAARHADARVDVYSLGGILFRCLSGETPREEAGSLASTLYAILKKPARRLEDAWAEATPELSAICAQALALEPEERTPDAASLAAALEAWLSGERARARAPEPATLGAPLAGFVVVALLALALGIGLALRSPVPKPSPRDTSRATPRRTPVTTPTLEPVWEIPPGTTLRYATTWHERIFLGLDTRIDSRLELGFAAVAGEPDLRELTARWEVLKAVSGPTSFDQPELFATTREQPALRGRLDLRTGELQVSQLPLAILPQILAKGPQVKNMDFGSDPGFMFHYMMKGMFGEHPLPRLLRLLFAARDQRVAGLRWHGDARVQRGRFEGIDPPLHPLFWTAPQDLRAADRKTWVYTIESTREVRARLPALLVFDQRVDVPSNEHASDVVELRLEAPGAR